MVYGDPLTESDDNDATQRCILTFLPIRYDFFSLKNLGKKTLSLGLTVKKSEYHNFLIIFVIFPVT